MLNQIRTFAKSKFAWLLVIPLIAAFAVWGISDIFTGGSGSAVVRAGGKEVSIRDFQADFEREVQRIASQQGGRFSAAEARAAGLHEMILQRAVQQTVIEAKAAELKLGASDTLVGRDLARIDGFKDPVTGRFSDDAYIEALYRNGYTRASFERELQKDIRRQQLIAATSSAWVAPEMMARTRVRYGQEKRKLDILVIPYAVVADGGPPPTADEVAAYHADNTDRYTAPERRAFTMVHLSVTDYLPTVAISEEDLRAEFDVRQASLQQAETRSVLQISAPDATAAAEAARMLRDGVDPANVVADLGLAEPTVYTDAPREEFFDSAVAEAAFTLDVGAVSAPVEGVLSWSVVRVDAINAPAEVTFEDARADLQRSLAEDIAAGKMFDAVDAFESARSDGLTMSEAATEAGLFTMSFDALDQRGFDRDGVRVPQVAASAEILNAVFESPENFESELIEVGDDGFAVIRVDRVEPSAVSPLDEVRDRVRAHLLAERAEERLAEIAATARERLEAGASLAEAAAAATPNARVDFAELTRGASTPDVSRALAFQAFGLGLGEVAEGRTQDGSLTLVRLGEIVPAPEPSAADLAAAQQAIQSEIDDDIARQLAAALQNAFDVRVNRNLFDTAVGADRDL